MKLEKTVKITLNHLEAKILQQAADILYDFFYTLNDNCIEEYEGYTQGDFECTATMLKEMVKWEEH